MQKLLIPLFAILIFTGCNDDKNPAISEHNHQPLVLRSTSQKIVKTGTVKRGQGLYQAMKNVAIENDLAHQLINELRDEVEFSKLKVGDELSATFDQNQILERFSFAQSPVEKHVLTFNKETTKWMYSLEQLPTTWMPRIVELSLQKGSTLQNDLLDLGLSRSVVNEIVNVFMCKVNFRRNARQGDKIKLLLNEQKYSDEIISTKVLYTSYSGIRAGNHEAFYYEDIEQKSTFTAHYSEDGTALINAGLRYPLTSLHVRSGFGYRRHPVTGRRAMHRGVDLRARRGQKVHAVASGRVVVSTFNQFAGNKIGIKHSDGSISFYYHLKSRGVNVGDRVRSYQVIGRVGATGRVTGPHLHFGFKKANGRWMNPFNKRMIATPKLKGRRKAALSEQVAHTRGLLADIELSKKSKYLVADLQGIGRNPSSVEVFSAEVELTEIPSTI